MNETLSIGVCFHFSPVTLFGFSQDGWGHRHVDRVKAKKRDQRHNVQRKTVCLSFQFAGNESRVSVVQYSGAKAQEVVQLGTNIASLTEFKQ